MGRTSWAVLVVVLGMTACGGAPLGEGDGGATDSTRQRIGAVALVLADLPGPDGGTTSISVAQAYFFDFPSDWDAGCTTVDAGACTFQRCPAQGAPPATLHAASAGTLQLQAGGAPWSLSPVTVPPFGVMYSDQRQARFVRGGEPVTITATGAEVPAFTTTVVAPPVVRVEALSGADGGLLTLASGAGVSASWQAVDAQVALSLSVASDGITCVFPGAAGSGQVPGELLALVRPGSGTLQVSGNSTAALDAGGWAVGIAVSEFARNVADGGVAIWAVQVR